MYSWGGTEEVFIGENWTWTIGNNRVSRFSLAVIESGATKLRIFDTLDVRLGHVISRGHAFTSKYSKEATRIMDSTSEEGILARYLF